MHRPTPTNFSDTPLYSVLIGRFDVFVTENFIQFLWWIGVFFAVVSWLISAVAGGAEAALAGVVMLIGGLFTFRIWLEMMVVAFRIANDLHAIREEVEDADTT